MRPETFLAGIITLLCCALLVVLCERVTAGFTHHLRIRAGHHVGPVRHRGSFARRFAHYLLVIGGIGGLTLASIAMVRS